MKGDIGMANYEKQVEQEAAYPHTYQPQKSDLLAKTMCVYLISIFQCLINKKNTIHDVNDVL